MQKKHWLWLAIIAVISVALVVTFIVRQQEEVLAPVEEPEQEPEEIEEVEEEEEQEPKEYPYYQPLTGIGSEIEVDNRVVAAMINNHSNARPHTGLDKADIVYEVLAEAWITRIIAIYQSELPEMLGSIRSLRPYYVDIAAGFDAVTAHAGAAGDVMDMAHSRGLDLLNANSSGGFVFYRTDFARAPHNLFTGKDRIEEGLQRFNYNEDFHIPELSFQAEDEVVEGEQAGWIEIAYGSSYTVGYEYDPETKLYTRYNQGTTLIDRVTEEPITMTNVFVVETPHEVVMSNGRRDIDVLGEGKGYLFQRGVVREVDWKHLDGVIRPFLDGEEVDLYPGKTWVNIVPTSPGIANMVEYKSEKE